MKTLLFSLFAAATLHAAPQAIFDGKSLEGWKVEGGPYWTIKESVLIGESDDSEHKKKGSNLWTTKEYKDFTIEFEFRYTSKNVTDERVDSGVFIRNSSDQIQIGVSGSKKIDLTGSPYIGAKKGYPIQAEGVAEVLKTGDWNKMKITAKGPVYTVEINGRKVSEYTSESASEKGPIGLQVHGGTLMKVEFRNMFVQEL
jgi:hypothetical protein